MDENKLGFLVVRVYQNEMIVIDTGEDKIEIYLSDRYKQPIEARVIFKTRKKYKINRVSKVKGATA